MPQTIRFITIIGPNNSPLYLKSFESEKNIRFHFLSHMALDYIVDKPAFTESPRDCSLLLVHDGVAVYGCSTNTNTKMLIGTDAHDNSRYDLRSAFKALHKAYISYMCNPFRDIEDLNSEIVSKSFDKSIEQLANAWNNPRK